LRCATATGTSLIPAGENRAAVAHIFDVFCNGNALLKNFNLAKEARQADVVIRKATDLRPNAQGKLLLSFVRWRDMQP